MDRTRLKVEDHEKIAFVIKDEGLQIQKLSVQNISVGGIGLLVSHFPNADLSRNIEAELRITSQTRAENIPLSSTFKISATVVHITATTVGLRFNTVSPELEFALEQYFKAELLGTRLNVVDKKFLKTENDILPIWLTDGRANEIYILADKTGILNFHLGFLGHYIEGEKGKKLRVGQITQSTNGERSNKYKGSELIDMTPKAELTSVRLARDFVANAKGIEASLLEELLGMLKIS